MSTQTIRFAYCTIIDSLALLHTFENTHRNAYLMLKNELSKIITS